MQANVAEITRESVAVEEQRWPALKRLNDATLDKPRGYVFGRSDAHRIAGGEEEFKRVSTKWKRCLEGLRGIKVKWSQRDQGYLFLTVEQHLTTHTESVARSMERTCRREATSLAVIRDDDMSSDHQRKLRVFKMQQFTDTAGKINSQREAARIALDRPETLPRLPAIDGNS